MPKPNSSICKVPVLPLPKPRPRPRRGFSTFVVCGGEAFPDTSRSMYEAGSLLDQLEAEHQIKSLEGSGGRGSTSRQMNIQNGNVDNCQNSNVNCIKSGWQRKEELPNSKSSLTLLLERKGGGPNIKEASETSDVTPADEMKMKMTPLLTCCNCKESTCDLPGFSCVQRHPICKECLRQWCQWSRPGSWQEKPVRFRCPVCAVFGFPIEMKHSNHMQPDIKFLCCCGKKILRAEIEAHKHCMKLKLNQSEQIFSCETFGSNRCEFCRQQIMYSKYVDHLLRKHFLRSFPKLSNQDLIKMPKSKPLFQYIFDLPLEEQRMTVTPSTLKRIVAVCDFGTFSIHQIRVEEKQLTWCLSLERNDDTATDYSTWQFHARLKFVAVVKNRLYQRICHAFVYPLAKGMDENIFLELVGKALPDAWLPKFKFAYTHKTTLNLQIYHSDGKYVRRSGRTIEVVQ